MVLAFSIWDDGTGRMLWLDGEKTRIDDDKSNPGVQHGPCAFKDGTDEGLHQDLKKHPATLKITDLKYGAIGSTFTGTPAPQRKFEISSDAGIDASSEGFATGVAKHTLLIAAVASFAL